MAKKSSIEEYLPSKADVMSFIMLYDFLESAYTEMKDFSKKNPDATLNERKVKSLNRILKDIKSILKNEPTASYMLPSNSDVVLTMSQYRSALENFRKKYRRYHNYDNYWHTSDGEIKARDMEGDRPQWK